MKYVNKLIGIALLPLTVCGLVSCDADEGFTPTTTVSTERPLAGHVSLHIISAPASDTDTRLAYEPEAGYRFETGDSLSARLMDTVASMDTTVSWYEKYRLTDMVEAETVFVRQQDGAWNASVELREGNYFFLYPYKSGQQVGTSCRFVLDGQTQHGTSAEAVTRAFAENNLYVGYAPVRADSACQGYNVSVELRPVFGALGIRVTNDGRQPYTLRRLTLRTLDGGFHTSVTLDPTRALYASRDGYFNIPQYLGDDSPEGIEAGYDASLADYSRREALRDLVRPTEGAEPAETVSLAVADAVPLKRQATQDFLVMLPEGVYTDLLLDIETIEGTVHNLLLEGRTEISTRLGALREVRFTDDDVSFLPETDASSTRDVEYLIRWNVNTETMLTATLHDNVRLSGEMYNQLRNGKSTGLTFRLNGYSVVIDPDVDATALSGKLFFEDTDDMKGRIIVRGKQYLSSGIPAMVRNEGELTLSGGEGYYIENLGTAEVTGKVTDCVWTGDGLLEVAQGAELSGDIAIQPDGLTLNYGTINGLSLNEGRLTNYGEATGDDTGFNTGEVDNEGGRFFISINEGDIRAKAESTTVIGDNAKGRIFITGLAEDGNLLVRDAGKQGIVIQELHGDVTTDAADSRANTLWIDSTLSGAKDAEGQAQDIDLSDYTVTATSPKARIENEGQEMKVSSLQVLPGAVLYIAHASVNTPVVRMEGNTTGTAELFISTFGNLYNGTSATRIEGIDETCNTVRNYGGQKTLFIVTGVEAQ